MLAWMPETILLLKSTRWFPWENFRPLHETAWCKLPEEPKSSAGRKPLDAVMMFKGFDGYLKAKGYLAMGGQIIDASIVSVLTQHNSRDENTTIKSGKPPEDWAGEPAKRCQKDTDGQWTQKHGKSHYGYKTTST